MLDFTATYTDQYELTMGQAYFLAGRKDESAVFDYFFRKNPFKGGYTVFAGLPDLLVVLERFRFDKADLDFLKAQSFHPDYVTFWKTSGLPARFTLPRKAIWYSRHAPS
jgi:nicotinate phosphoribosyltransferase